MSKKFYGIVLVNRRLYILSLLLLFYLLLKTIFMFTFSLEKNIDNINKKVNSVYDSNQVECIVEAVYFEARGESEEGWKAVTEVIVNRQQLSNYPNTLCEVVHQNKQFSYRNGDKKHNLHYNNPQLLYSITNTIYNHLYNINKSNKYRILPECVTHYDGKAFKKPSWANQMDMVKEVGGHQFYCKK